MPWPKGRPRSPYRERRIVCDRDDKYAADRAKLTEEQRAVYRDMRGKGFRHSEAISLAVTRRMS